MLINFLKQHHSECFIPPTPQQLQFTFPCLVTFIVVECLQSKFVPVVSHVIAAINTRSFTSLVHQTKISAGHVTEKL